MPPWVLALLMAGVFAVGCAKGVGTWSRAEAPPTPQDRFDCLQAASYPRQFIIGTAPIYVSGIPVGGGTYGGTRMVTDPKLYGACMEAKGYAKVED